MLIAGKRGSGKSYDLGIIAEGLCALSGSAIAYGTDQFALILFDTQNQFWTLAETVVELEAAQRAAIGQWNIDGNTMKPPTVFRPRGTQSVADFEEEFALRPASLEGADWAALCNLDRFSLPGQCLYKAREAVAGSFGIRDMVEWLTSDAAVQEFPENTRNAVRWRLEAQERTFLFDPNAKDIGEALVSPGNKSIIELAGLDDDTKSVIVAVILRHLINLAGPAHRKRKIAAIRGRASPEDGRNIAPRVWALIDEAHLICPADRSTAARPVVVDYVKRGRDAGLSLVMATQQPSALDSAAVSQSDIVVVHKLTIESDIQAATHRMPTRGPTTVMRGHQRDNFAGMTNLARILDAGQSLFADSESDRAFFLQSRPRVTPHGGGEPEL
jgi:hypothetical protein